MSVRGWPTFAAALSVKKQIPFGNDKQKTGNSKEKRRLSEGMTKREKQIPAGMTNKVLFVVVEKAEDIVFLEFVCALEEVEFDGEAEADYLSAELADELDGGFHGAAGGE